MDKNFKIRVVVALSMLIVAVMTMHVLDGILFKIIYGIFALMALVELLSFFKKKFSTSGLILALIEIVFLVCSVVFVTQASIVYFWYVVLGVCGYDAIAYLAGRAVGGKIFKKSRPFPRISKNKTWEGTVLGIVASVGMVAGLMAALNAFSSDWIYLFCGLFALAGDLFESFLKRKFKVKDSNEIVIKNKVFEKLELVVGGSEGHGGFLDRVDSVAFASTILLIISWFF